MGRRREQDPVQLLVVSTGAVNTPAVRLYLREGFDGSAMSSVRQDVVVGSLLIMTGPPGAGKSTVSAVLAARLERSVLVEGDRFFAFLAAGAIAPWLVEAHAQNEAVIEAAAAAAGRFAQDYDTVYDGVVGPWFLQGFARAAGLTSLDYVIMLPPLEVCLERVRTRVGHGFTDEAVARRMYSEFATADIEDRHVIRTETIEPESTADEVERAVLDGSLRHTVGG